jgi:hypothetical protein
VYSNQSYNLSSTETDMTTTGSSAPSYSTSDAWNDTNQMSVTGSGSSGTLVGSSATSYSWQDNSDGSANSGTGTSSWQTTTSATLPQGVLPPSLDGTSVPEDGAEQWGGAAPVSGSPDLSQVATTGAWMSSQSQYAELVTNSGVDLALDKAVALGNSALSSVKGGRRHGES